MHRSVLRFRHIATADDRNRPVALLLHGNRGGMDDLIPFAEALDLNLRLIAPEAARGVYSGIEIVSRTWYGGELGRPEPASFGDSLAQVELLTLDQIARWSAADEKPWLIGFDQGAVLALSLGLIAPDLVSGVVSINGALPAFVQADLLPPIASDLPVLLVNEPDDPALPRDVVNSTVATLVTLGNDVTAHRIAGARHLGPEIRHLVQTWLEPRIAAP